MINFPQRVGALREFVVDVLGKNDDITHFEYTKKNSRERVFALIGIELKKPADYTSLIKRLNKKKIKYEHLNTKPELFHYLV
jgi:threonine dehydratase